MAKAKRGGKTPTGFVVVSKQVAEGGKPVGFLYREEPGEEGDSGWRVFSGEEDEKYNKKADHFVLMEPAALLAVDCSVSEILKQDVGAAFEREEKGQPFHAVDWEEGE